MEWGKKKVIVKLRSVINIRANKFQMSKISEEWQPGKLMEDNLYPYPTYKTWHLMVVLSLRFSNSVLSRQMYPHYFPHIFFCYVQVITTWLRDPRNWKRSSIMILWYRGAIKVKRRYSNSFIYRFHGESLVYFNDEGDLKEGKSILPLNT